MKQYQSHKLFEHDQAMEEHNAHMIKCKKVKCDRYVYAYFIVVHLIVKCNVLYRVVAYHNMCKSKSIGIWQH